MQEPPRAAPGHRPARDPAGSFTLRLAVFYGALFLIYGVHLPYLPIWLDWRGLTPSEIAAITATPFFLRVVITPAVAIWADHHQAHRAVALRLGAMGLLFALLLSHAQSFWMIALAAIPFAISFSTIMPLAETIAVSGVRAHGLDYGRMRLWGSLTFVAAGYACGWLIDHQGAGAQIWCLTFGAAATAATAYLLPGPPGAEPIARAAGEGRTRRVSLAVFGRLVRQPLFLVFLVAVGTVQGAHGMFYTFGTLTWRNQGISSAWIGTLWAIGIGCEVALFAYSGAAVRRFGASWLMVSAAGAAVLRWVVMSFAPPLAVLVPVQMLHGLTYGASHLGAMHFISQAMPESAQGTAQAFYATVAAGLMMGGATLVAGHLYASAGALGYLVMALIAAVGLAASLVILKRWDGTRLPEA